jgi:hypothetical protein
MRSWCRAVPIPQESTSSVGPRDSNVTQLRLPPAAPLVARPILAAPRSMWHLSPARTAPRHYGGPHAQTRWCSAFRLLFVGLQTARRRQRLRAQLSARPPAPDGWILGRLPSSIEKTPNPPGQPSGCLPQIRCATIRITPIILPESPSARNFLPLQNPRPTLTISPLFSMTIDQ